MCVELNVKKWWPSKYGGGVALTHSLTHIHSHYKIITNGYHFPFIQWTHTQKKVNLSLMFTNRLIYRMFVIEMCKWNSLIYSSVWYVGWVRGFGISSYNLNAMKRHLMASWLVSPFDQNILVTNTHTHTLVSLCHWRRRVNDRCFDRFFPSSFSTKKLSTNLTNTNSNNKKNLMHNNIPLD